MFLDLSAIEQAFKTVQLERFAKVGDEFRQYRDIAMTSGNFGSNTCRQNLDYQTFARTLGGNL